MSTWYSAFDHVVTEEAGGTGFLQMKKAEGCLLKSHPVRTRMSNVLGYYGASKPKAGTPEYRTMKVDELTNMLDIAAVLSGNTIQDLSLIHI